MKVEIRGKVINFDKSIGTYSKDEFTKLCKSLPVFQELPIKERNDKIKECYGKYFGNVKQSKKSKSGSNLRNNDVESNRGDSGAESRSNDGGSNINGSKDKAKLQSKKVRTEEKDT